MDEQSLAILGEKPMITESFPEMFHWPVVTTEDEEAVISVLRSGTMSGTDITRQFEREFATWAGVRYALGTCNGTAALQEALWACGVKTGTEVICPSMTYWASCASALTLGAEVNFADIDPVTLCINPADIEHRINERTAAIMVVHYAGHPADMDAILEIARKHRLRVIEDVSHAQGALYKNRMCGTLGDIAGISMMGGKSFAIGEGGMVLTNDRELFERCMAFGHYERLAASRYSTTAEKLQSEELVRLAGVPLGGVKHRMNQTCSAMGRVQLRHYPERMAEIQKAMNYFWECLEGVPGIRPHRVTLPGCTMGGWYRPRGLYHTEELGNLSCERFCRAVAAEGVVTGSGANNPLHLHPYFTEFDPVGKGRIPLRQDSLPWSERIAEITFAVPWFKHYRPEIIDLYAAAFRKVTEHYRELL